MLLRCETNSTRRGSAQKHIPIVFASYFPLGFLRKTRELSYLVLVFGLAITSFVTNIVSCVLFVDIWIIIANSFVSYINSFVSHVRRKKCWAFAIQMPPFYLKE